MVQWDLREAIVWQRLWRRGARGGPRPALARRPRQDQGYLRILRGGGAKKNNVKICKMQKKKGKYLKRNRKMQENPKKYTQLRVLTRPAYIYSRTHHQNKGRTTAECRIRHDKNNTRYTNVLFGQSGVGTPQQN